MPPSNLYTGKTIESDVETGIMTLQSHFQVMYILICDGSFLSINLKLSGRVVGLYSMLLG